MAERTLNNRMSSAAICRRNGWLAGTKLTAERLPKEPHAADPKLVTITAVGQSKILVIDDELPYGEQEIVMDLHTRDWVEVR